jgi:voltage-gated potassium channel
MSTGGQMVLSERRAAPDEVGLTMAEVTGGMVVQIHSHGRDIPFTERNRYIIQPQDTLLIISPPGDRGQTGVSPCSAARSGCSGRRPAAPAPAG